MKLPVGFVVPVFVLAAALPGCDTGDHSTAGQANVSLYVIDAPLDLAGVHAVNVTVSEVVLYPAETGDVDAGGVEMTGGPIGMSGDLTLNLLDFRNGQVAFVGSQTVPAGSYARLRLQVVSAELVRDDDGDSATPDITEPIVVPSGKVDVPVAFQLTAGENLAITIDFDAQASVQVNTTSGTNSYLLRPVINVAGMKQS